VNLPAVAFGKHQKKALVSYTADYLPLISSKCPLDDHITQVYRQFRLMGKFGSRTEEGQSYFGGRRKKMSPTK
jgi:hypothetical protein